MEEKKTNKKKLFIIIGICCFIVGVILGVTAFLLTKDKDNPNKNGNTPNEKKELHKPLEIDLDLKMEGNELSNFDLAFMIMENYSDNQIYSPLSIKYALSMLSIGTDGDSKTQIDGVLGNYVAKKYQSLDEISVANGLFINETYKNNLDSAYQKRLENQFNAELKLDSFKKADNINNWVKSKTLNLIEKLFEDSDLADSKFILINALGIKMDWMNDIENEYNASFAHENISLSIPEYDEDNRTTYNFNGTNVKGYKIGAVVNNYDLIKTEGEENIKKTVTEKYNEYLKTDNCAKGQAMAPAENYVAGYLSDLKFNYQKATYSTDFSLYVDDDVKVFAKKLKDYNGSQLEYVAIMPQKETLSEYIKNIDASKVNGLTSKLKDLNAESFEEGYVTKITGTIPEFKFDYNLNLDADLKGMGITDVFDPTKANFKRMTDLQDLYIQTKHKATIDFSNSGIKAAAVTSISLTENALEYNDKCTPFDYVYDVPTKEIDITIDKPYLFLIRNAETNEVWFAGTVYNPTAA